MSDLKKHIKNMEDGSEELVAEIESIEIVDYDRKSPAVVNAISEIRLMLDSVKKKINYIKENVL
jgi:hypothetical protein